MTATHHDHHHGHASSGGYVPPSGARFTPNAIPITVPTTVSAAVVGPACVVLGWSLRETTGAAPATVEVWDGQDTTGQLIATISLLAGQSTRDWLGPQGVITTRGLFVSIVAGAIKGAIWALLPYGGEE
jgi:hypothetical protein